MTTILMVRTESKIVMYADSTRTHDSRVMSNHIDKLQNKNSVLWATSGPDALNSFIRNLDTSDIGSATPVEEVYTQLLSIRRKIRDEIGDSDTSWQVLIATGTEMFHMNAKVGVTQLNNFRAYGIGCGSDIVEHALEVFWRATYKTGFMSDASPSHSSEMLPIIEKYFGTAMELTAPGTRVTSMSIPHQYD